MSSIIPKNWKVRSNPNKRALYGSVSVKLTPELMVPYEREAASATTSRDREPFRISSDVVGNSGPVQ